jgi:DNA oxidative demethylase
MNKVRAKASKTVKAKTKKTKTNKTIVSTLNNFNIKTCDNAEEARQKNRSLVLAPKFYGDIKKGLNVMFIPEILDSELANHLFNLLMKIEYLSDEDSMVTVMGRRHVIPRKQTAFGANGMSYTFAGATIAVNDWDRNDYDNMCMTEAAQIIRFIASRLSDQFGQKFNYALINLYPDEKSRIGYHVDDEKDLCKNPMILGISLGQEREIYFKHKDRSDKPVKVSLPHNSLVMMGYPTNKHYKHSIPSKSAKMSPRISMTFRGIE